jgi:glycerol-3-phosphate dehydrogenase (NAD(P)+)
MATAAAVTRLSARLAIEMPICEVVDALLHRGWSIDEMTDLLLRRPYRTE